MTAALLCLLAAAGTEPHDAPVVLTVAGSDSGGGAGIQADLKTCEANGVFGTTAIVALTAQNTIGVQGVEPIDDKFVTKQIDSVLSDMGAHAIKTGMLPTAEAIQNVAKALDAHKPKGTVRVIDPVFVAASGDTLVSPDAIDAIRKILVPTATVLTPNMPEAGKLLSQAPPQSVEQMRTAAERLLEMRAQSVLLKGGRLSKGDMVDVYADRGGEHGAVRIVELRYERIETQNTHGAGCTLAAAIAAELAKQVHAGYPVDTLGAVRAAREYLRDVFVASSKLDSRWRSTLRIGTGARGPLNHAKVQWGDKWRPSSVYNMGASEQTLSARLWNDDEVANLRDACLANGFIRGLADGSLAKSQFAGYVAQDRFFLEVFARAYTLALAKLPASDTTGIKEFAGLVRGVIDELQLHAGYASQLGVDMSVVEPVPAALAYTDFLNDVAHDEDVVACAAAMVPCMRLYAYLGQRLARSGSPIAPKYKEWVDTYSDPGFEELAASLERLLDRYAARLEGGYETRYAELRGLYVKAMQLELGFFDAWAPKEHEDAQGGAPPDRQEL